MKIITIFVLGLMWINYPQTAVCSEPLPLYQNSELKLNLNKMQKEVWKDIPEYSGYYKASNLGRIKSIERIISCYHGLRTMKERILKGNKDKDGYIYLVLSKRNEKKTFKVHRLIGTIFIKNTNNKNQINHINGIKSDNRVENLEWCTNSENQLHAYRTGLSSGQKGYNNRRSKLVEKYSLDGKLICEYGSIKQAARMNKMPHTNISRVCRGLNKTSHNYYWKFKNIQI